MLYKISKHISSRPVWFDSWYIYTSFLGNTYMDPPGKQKEKQMTELSNVKKIEKTN